MLLQNVFIPSIGFKLKAISLPNQKDDDATVLIIASIGCEYVVRGQSKQNIRRLTKLQEIRSIKVKVFLLQVSPVLNIQCVYGGDVPTSKLGLCCVSLESFREADEYGSAATSILPIHDKLCRQSRMIISKTKHLSHGVEWKNMCTHMKTVQKETFWIGRVAFTKS